MSVVTGTTRALACLALGHDEDGSVRCPSSDEDLVRQLVEQVQALRVAAGVVEESEVDRAERIEVVEDVLSDVLVDSDAVIDPEVARRLVERLDGAGWTLHPVRRP